MTAPIGPLHPNLKQPREEQAPFTSSPDYSDIGKAIIGSRPQEALELVKKGSSFAWIEKGCNLLTLAINNCPHLELIQTLVKMADACLLNHIDSRGFTALTSAAAIGQYEIVQLLLQNGADPNLANRYNKTPLYEIVWFYPTEFSLKCLMNKKKINHDELVSNIVNIAKTLIKHGAYVDDPIDKTKPSPLQAAVNLNKIYPQVISYLIEEGADIGRAVRNHTLFSQPTEQQQQLIDQGVQEGLGKRKEKIAPVLQKYLPPKELLRLVCDYV